MQMYIESENIIGHEQAGFRQYKIINDAFQA